VNKNSFCISSRFYGCLCAVLMLANVAQAQENVVLKEATLAVSPAASESRDMGSAKAEPKILGLPTAPNVDLKDVVDEASEMVVEENVLPKQVPFVPLAKDTTVSVEALKTKRKKQKLPKAPNMDLKDVVDEYEELVPTEAVLPKSAVTSENDSVPAEERFTNIDEKAPQVSIEEQAAIEQQAAIVEQAAIAQQVALDEQAAIDEQSEIEQQAVLDQTAGGEEQKPDELVEPKEKAPLGKSKFILGMEVPANTATRLIWTPESKAGGLAERTPVLVVNGKLAGETLCVTGAVHGDELNGIEMIRQIMYQLDADKLTGTVIGIPVVNLMGFRRNSRYLPDRRDLNRYFPGNTRGSSASRIAHSFFTKIILHCDLLIDIHTGSLNRTNLTQLRADLSNQQVVSMAKSFGPIAVLNSRGNPRSLRAASVRAGIPSITIEAGEPMRIQREVVAEGTKAIEKMMATMGMYGRSPRKSSKTAPVYYKSAWVRANQSGIFISDASLGERVVEGEVLGTVTDPITNRRSEILAHHQGRILGMALDQVVLPGFAIYHIGIQTPEALLIEEGQLTEENPNEDEPALGQEPSAEGVDSTIPLEVPMHDALDDD
jgi:predicted deacylase